MSCVFLWRQGNKALLLVTLRQDFTSDNKKLTDLGVGGPEGSQHLPVCTPRTVVTGITYILYFIWVPGIWTWVLCLHRKHSCTLNHLSQAHCMNFFLIKKPCLPLGSYNLRGLNHLDRKTLAIKLQWYLTSILLINRQLWVLHFSAAAADIYSSHPWCFL